MASLTVTAVIKAKDEGNGEIDESEVGGRTSITISEKTGETTVVMEQVSDATYVTIGHFVMIDISLFHTYSICPCVNKDP